MVGDIYKVEFVGNIEGQETVNVRHYRVITETPTGLTELGVANAATNLVSTPYKQATSVEFTFVGTRAQRITPPPAGESAASITGQGPGLIAGDALPSFVAGVISLRTGIAGRGFRGRAYIPGIPELGTDGSRLTSTQITSLESLGNAMTTNLVQVDGTLEPVIYRRAVDTARRISSYIVRQETGTTRSRKVGRGA